MGMRHTAVVVGLALGLISGTASAAPLQFKYDGSVDYTFYLDSNPIPAAFNGISTRFRFDADGEQDNSGPDVITFTTPELNGGFFFQAIGQDFKVNGQQIFSGSTSNPVFSTGIFTLVGDPGVAVSTLTISSVTATSPVPLPASAPMFGAALLGLAGLGYAAKRKKAATAA